MGDLEFLEQTSHTLLTPRKRKIRNSTISYLKNYWEVMTQRRWWKWRSNTRQMSQSDINWYMG